MITNKYHIASLISVFLALGLGIFIGGAANQNWVAQTETKVAQMMMDKYKDAVTEAKQLRQQMDILKEFHRSRHPWLVDKTFYWIDYKESLPTSMLGQVIELAGGSWQGVTEGNVDQMLHLLCEREICPDYVLVADSQLWHEMKRMSEHWRVNGKTINMIRIEAINQLEEHTLEIVRLLRFINHISEDNADEAIRFYHYPSME